MIEILKVFYLLILSALGFFCLFTYKKGSLVIKSYAILTLIVELIGFSYLFNFKTPYGYLYNIYSIVEILLWLMLFHKLLKARILFLIALGGVYYFIFMYLGDFNFQKLNNNGFLLNNCIITTLITFYLYQIIDKNLNLDGYFWIMAGALFYNLGGFLLTGLIQIVAKKDPGLGSALFNINTILNIFYYSFFFYGIYLLNKKEPGGPNVN